MQIVLVMFRDNGQRRSFSLTRDVTVIGRREDCDFRIPLGEVSRKHCRLLRQGDGVRVEDLGSSNGTFVNGRRVQEAELHAGDTLQIGPLAFVLQLDGQPDEEHMSPVLVGAVGAAPGGSPSPTDDAGIDPTTLLMDNPDDSTANRAVDDDAIIVDFKEPEKREP